MLRKLGLIEWIKWKFVGGKLSGLRIIRGEIGGKVKWKLSKCKCLIGKYLIGSRRIVKIRGYKWRIK